MQPSRNTGVTHDNETPHRQGNHLVSGSVKLQIILLLLVGIISYGNSLHGPFHFDDLGITEKSFLWPRAFTFGPRQFVDLTFVLNHLVNGQNVFGYHLVNLTVHLFTTVIFYFLVYSAIIALYASFSPSSDQTSVESLFISHFVPCASALLFVCHPVQTQAVSYIVQRYAAMATLFYMLSALSYIRARLSSSLNAPSWHTWLLSLSTLLTGFIAVRCKEIAYTLPVMLIVIELFLFKGKVLRNRLFMICSTILLLIVPILFTIRMGAGGIEDLLYALRHSTKEELTYSRTEYLFTQFRVVVSYLRLLLLPVNQNLDYDIPLQKSFFSVPVLASLGLHLIIIVTSIVLFIRSRRILSSAASLSGVCLRLISLGIIWFYLALMIESSIIPILDVMFEHRIYLPSGGAFLAFSATVGYLLSSRRFFRATAWSILLVVCGCLTYATIQRNRIWNDDLLLWEDTANKSPHKPRVLANLAAVYLRNKMPEKAIPPLLHAIEISPGFTDVLNYLGTTLDLLGTYPGRYDNGRRYIIGVRTVDMRHYNDWFANSKNNLGLIYEHIGNLAAARRCYESATNFAPAFDLAWYNLYQSAVRQQDHLGAASAFERLKALNPSRAANSTQQQVGSYQK